VEVIISLNSLNDATYAYILDPRFVCDPDNQSAQFSQVGWCGFQRIADL
jgi:hypothetical protein